MMPVPCFVCKKALKSAMDGADNQPDNGLSFMAYGNYGSTVFDPGDGSYLEINICDNCVKENISDILYGVAIKRSDIILKPWNGKVG